MVEVRTRDLHWLVTFVTSFIEHFSYQRYLHICGIRMDIDWTNNFSVFRESLLVLHQGPNNTDFCETIERRHFMEKGLQRLIKMNNFKLSRRTRVTVLG